MTQTTDQLDAAIDDVIDTLRAPSTVRAHIYPFGPARYVSVELVAMSHDCCDSCGERINVDRPGPVAWIDERTGDVQGSWSHQHGCGTWNQPFAVRREVELDDVDADTLAGIVEAMHAELVELVTDDVTERTADIRRGLAEDLTATLARYDEPLDEDETRQDREDETTTGSDVSPGIYRDGDEWYAWAYEPLGGEPVSVAASELR